LLARTCETVTDWAATGTVPGALAALTKGGLTMRLSLLFGGVLALGITGAVFAALPASAPPVPPKPPVLARADDKKPDAKADAKPALGAPRLVRAIDDSMAHLVELVWNEKGTHLGVQGFEDQKNQFTGVSLYPLDANVSPVYGTRWGAEQLVAVTPDGTGAVTLLRESHLISGNHRLTFLAPEAIGGFGGGPRGIAGFEATRTVKLEPSPAEQHAFAPDLKSFRMLAPVETVDGDKPTWEVVEVSAETGETGKPLLKLPKGAVRLSPKGRLAAHAAPGANGFAVHDVDGAKKLFEFDATGGPGRSPDRSKPTVVFAPNERLVLVTQGLGSAVIVDTTTGRPVREFEGLGHREPKRGEPPVVLAEVVPSVAAFSSDGRLFAALLSRTRVSLKQNVGPDGKPLERREHEPTGSALVVWDTQTGKVVKSWPASGVLRVAFNPARPVLALAEHHGDKVRIGFWDFAAEVQK
jgi:hypothetical protein